MIYYYIGALYVSFLMCIIVLCLSLLPCFLASSVRVGVSSIMILRDRKFKNEGCRSPKHLGSLQPTIAFSQIFSEARVPGQNSKLSLPNDYTLKRITS